MKKNKKKDVEWPLIGWCFSANELNTVSQTVDDDFPSVCNFKVISKGSQKSISELIDSLSVALNRKIHLHEYKVEKKEKSRFHCINLHLLIKNSEDIQKVLTTIKDGQKIKYIL